MCAAGRDCASMCFLAKLLTTSRAGLAGSAVLSFGYGKLPYPLYNSRVVRKEGSFSGQSRGVCLLPGKSLSGARTGLTDSAVSAFGCSAAVLFYQSGTARRSAPPPFSPSSQQWGMGREPHGCPPLLTFPQSTGARISPFPVMGYGAEAAPEWKSRKICQFCTRRCELASGHMLPHFALSWGHESPMITYRPCPFGKAAGRAWRASLYPPFQVAGYGAEAPCSPIALALLAKRRAEHGALPSVPLS